MRVFRDDWGIPHLRAGSVDELAYLQGRTTAVDRGHQLEVDRRRSEGRLAELVGPAELPWDRFARRARLDDTARRCFDNLDDETRRWVTAYADGVRSRLDDWKPWSSLGVFLARHVLFGTFPLKMWRAHVARSLGPSWVDTFVRDTSGGSNAWAVSGLLAGDPHRMIELPNVYQQVRLACPEFDVVGLAFPGVPGVQHFGHTGGVAWAVTNAMADYQDLYVEDTRRTPDGAVEARWAHGWEPAHAHTETIAVRGGDPETVEVIETARGPIVDASLSLRTPSRIELDAGFAALLPLLRASTSDDVADALRHWVEPVNSVLVADTAGRTLQLAAGRVPLRDPLCRRVPVPAWEPRYAWRSGYADMPRVAVDGVAVNANDRRPDTAPLGIDFARPHRAGRIRALIDAGAAPEEIHMDTVAPRLLPDRLAHWDGRMDADNTAAGAYAAWRAGLARRLLELPALRPLTDPSGYDPLFAPWLDPRVRIGAALDSVLSELSRHGVDVPLDGPAPTGRWGDRHVLEPVRAPGLPDVELPRVELSGDSDCVLATHSAPGVSDACWRGPVARYVWNLADRQRSRWIVPFGASDRPGDPHFADQLPLWATGRLAEVITDWDRLTEEPPPLS
ncbi:MAG TPA: penicillin acylase family protein [Actinoplanes sp.]